MKNTGAGVTHSKMCVRIWSEGGFSVVWFEKFAMALVGLKGQ